MVEGLQVLGCYGKVADSKLRLGPRLVNAVCSTDSSMLSGLDIRSLGLNTSGAM